MKTKPKEGKTLPIFYTNQIGGLFSELDAPEDLVKKTLTPPYSEGPILGKDKEDSKMETSFIYIEIPNTTYKVHSLLFSDGSRWDAYNGWGREKNPDYYHRILKESQKRSHEREEGQSQR